MRGYIQIVKEVRRELAGQHRVHVLARKHYKATINITYPL